MINCVYQRWNTHWICITVIIKALRRFPIPIIASHSLGPQFNHMPPPVGWAGPPPREWHSFGAISGASSIILRYAISLTQGAEEWSREVTVVQIGRISAVTAKWRQRNSERKRNETGDTETLGVHSLRRSHTRNVEDHFIQRELSQAQAPFSNSRTRVYINLRDIHEPPDILMPSHVSLPFSVLTPMLTKEIKWAPAACSLSASTSCIFAIQRSRFPPGFPNSCGVPKLLPTPALETISPKTCPNPKPISETTNQARFQKLSEQQMKYRESMVSSYWKWCCSPYSPNTSSAV